MNGSLTFTAAAAALLIGTLSFVGCQPERNDEATPSDDESGVTAEPRADSIPEQHEGAPAYSLSDAGDALVSQQGLEIPIRVEAINGSVDHWKSAGGTAELAGWAAHVESSTPADVVVVVKGDEVVVTSAPNLDRPDVAKHFGDDAFTTSGYQLEFPADDGMRVRVYAVVGEHASELPYAEGYPWGTDHDE